MRKMALSTLAGFAVALTACGGGASQEEEPAVADDADAASGTVAGEETPEGADIAGDPEADATPTPTPSPTPSAAASASPSPAAPAPAAAAAVTAPPAFALCRACHSVEPGQNGIGPTLAGVYGAKSAHISSFDYSAAMEGAGLTWNEATLDRYLENPNGTVPGTTMSFAGVKNAAQRKAIVDYLKTL